MPLATATTTPTAFEHLVLDFLAELEFERGLSRNTLEAYRSDLLQFGAWLAQHDGDATTVQHRDLTSFLDEPPRGNGGPPASRAGDVAAQGGVPALVLPAPAPRGRDRARPDRRP